MGVKLETRRGFDDHFFYFELKSVTAERDFVKCAKCNGTGYFRGTQGQRHQCRACDSAQRYYPFLPQGYVMDPGHSPLPRNSRLVIQITRAQVWSISLSDAGDGQVQINYVYDHDYDGDISLEESSTYDTYEQAIEAAHKTYDENPQFYAHKGPITGVLFATQIED